VHITPRGPSLFPISQPPGSTVSIMYNDGMSLISVILSAIVLAWLDGYLRRQSELRIPPNEHGSVVLRANAINARLGWYALAIAFLFAIGAIFYAGSLRETVTFVALAGATGLGGVLLIAYYRNTIIKFYDEKIESQDIFGKTRTLRWNDVTAVRKIPRAPMLKTPTEKIIVPSEAVGFASLVEAVRKHLKPDVSQQALKEISQE